MAASVLVPGPALHPLLQLVEPPDGAAGDGLEADGDDGRATHTLPLTTAGFVYENIFFFSFFFFGRMCQLIYCVSRMQDAASKKQKPLLAP